MPPECADTAAKLRRLSGLRKIHVGNSAEANHRYARRVAGEDGERTQAEPERPEPGWRAERYSPTLKANPAQNKIRVNIREMIIESTLGVTISVDGGASG
jgi:hypothetical protein